MPPTQKQLEANRKNAQKSTGPKTPEGKARASKNSLKFGLRSADIIISSKYFAESREDYEDLLDSLKMELRPHSAMQEYLVTKIANCLWRYRRVLAAETAKINRQLRNINDFDDIQNAETDPEHRDNLEYYVGTNQIPKTESFQLYEMRLEHQLLRAYRMLFRLQKYGNDLLKQRLTRQEHARLKREEQDRLTRESSSPTNTPPADNPADPNIPDASSSPPRETSTHDACTNEPNSPQPVPP